MSLRRRLEQRLGTGRFFGAGELRASLLALLAEAPAHGYQLMTRLEERCGGHYRPSAGAIYPTLQQLEDEGLARAELKDERRVYRLTAEGRRAQADCNDDAEAVWARAVSLREWGVFRDPHAAEIVAPALKLAKAALKAVVHARGDTRVVEAVRAVFEDARARIERIDRRRE